MPASNRLMNNRELQREQDYDLDELPERVQTNIMLLNSEQNVNDSLMKVVDDGMGGFYFLSARHAKRSSFG